jgi:hypothetical protein
MSMNLLNPVIIAHIEMNDIFHRPIDYTLCLDASCNLWAIWQSLLSLSISSYQLLPLGTLFFIDKSDRKRLKAPDTSPSLPSARSAPGFRVAHWKPAVAERGAGPTFLLVFFGLGVRLALADRCVIGAAQRLPGAQARRTDTGPPNYSRIVDCFSIVLATSRKAWHRRGIRLHVLFLGYVLICFSFASFRLQ